MNDLSQTDQSEVLGSAISSAIDLSFSEHLIDKIIVKLNASGYTIVQK